MAGKSSGIIIIILTILYILFITKLADILTSGLENPDSATQGYTMLLYILSIMGMVIGYMWLNDNKKGNYVLRMSFTIGGVIILAYTMTNYWEFLNEYSKLTLLGACLLALIYYIYNF